ncbi:MAG: type II secretion system protein [Candidatus Shapirobacteria bacterium]
MKRRKGMSLIELVVVTALIMVLAGGGGVALNTFNEKQKVVTARDELVASLRLARNAARTAKGPTNREINYVAVTIATNGLILAVDDSEAVTYVSKDVTQEGVTISQTPSGRILFLPYETKLVMIDGAGKVVDFGNSYTVTVTSGMGTTATVVISSNGLIDGQ